MLVLAASASHSGVTINVPSSAQSPWPLLIAFLAGVAVPILIEIRRAKNARQNRLADLEEARNDRAQERAEAHADRENERAQVRERRHVGFQRETLLELQDSLSDLARANGDQHHLDIMHFRNAGVGVKFGDHQLPEELDNRINTLQRRILLLASRIESESIRNLVDIVNDGMVVQASKLFDSEADAELASRPGTQAYSQVIQEIGAEVRRLHPAL